jgi:hypothetical protein
LSLADPHDGRSRLGVIVGARYGVALDDQGRGGEGQGGALSVHVARGRGDRGSPPRMTTGAPHCSDSAQTARSRSSRGPVFILSAGTRLAFAATDLERGDMLNGDTNEAVPLDLSPARRRRRGTRARSRWCTRAQHLPLLIVLACPLMMFVMMRGMGCNSHEHGHAPRPAEEPERRPIPPQARR